jgi:integrase
MLAASVTDLLAAICSKALSTRSTTGLTWMADAGVPVHVLRKIAGHGSLTTTQRYLHPDERSITEAGDALTAHLSVRRSPNGPQLRVV